MTSSQSPASTPASTPRPSNLNLPNALTTLRMVLVPFFALALLVDHGHDATWRVIAWAIFFVAMVTDKIDGDIARKRGLVTDFGKIADPIADKAMTGMAFIGLSVLGDVWWWVTIVVLVREWTVTALRLSILRRLVVAADRLGKLKTMVQAFALGFLVLPWRDRDLPGWFHPIGTTVFYLAEVALGVAVVLTLVSGAQFYLGVWRQRHLLTARAEGSART